MDAQIRDNELVLHDPVASMLPEPVAAVVGASAAVALAADVVTAHLGVIYVPRPITVKSLVYWLGAGVGAAGSIIRIAVYTEDGQTKIIDVTDAVGTTVDIQRVVDVAPDLAVEAGNYIILICHSVYSTTAKTVMRYTYDTTLLLYDATPDADLSGTYTIAGGAAPATITIDGFASRAGALIPVVRFLGTA
jgi:hypothetical protein